MQDGLPVNRQVLTGPGVEKLFWFRLVYYPLQLAARKLFWWGNRAYNTWNEIFIWWYVIHFLYEALIKLQLLFFFILSSPRLIKLHVNKLYSLPISYILKIVCGLKCTLILLLLAWSVAVQSYPLFLRRQLEERVISSSEVCASHCLFVCYIKRTYLLSKNSLFQHIPIDYTPFMTNSRYAEMKILGGKLQ